MSLLNVILSFFITAVVAQRNNVCKTFADYYFIDVSPNCRYNPDVTANATDLIIRNGYSVESYQVVTKDFYVLTVFRIPPKNGTDKGIVFLQHPATSCCTIWLDLGNKSFAFMLAKEGYDVWLGNFRGTIYSRENLYLPTNSNAYWNVSFHEMAIYDLPAQLDLVRRKTGYASKLYYVGHSMSSTTALIYSSLLPQHAQDTIKLFVLWAPVAHLKYMPSPAKYVAPFTNLLMSAGRLFHQVDLVPRNGTVHTLAKIFCFTLPPNLRKCAEILQLFAGYDRKNFDPERLPLMIYQNFAGLPLKALAHYGQIRNAKGRFQYYDYGKKKNEYYYHSQQPPLYPLQNISVPMYFMYGGHDELSDPKDVINLYNELPSIVRYGISSQKEYNHFDYMYAKNVDESVYQPTIQIIENY